jgi:hypothetical protein
MAYRIDPFTALPADEAAEWIGALHLEKANGFQLTGANLSLLDVTISAVRVETADCIDDRCPTVFRYRMGRVFQVVITCKQTMAVYTRATEDVNGKHVFSLFLDTGRGMTTQLTPTSLGPVVTTTRNVESP